MNKLDVIMPKQDFDIDQLANYLHLTPAQVSRLAERDKLPGRRIGGEWRFSRAEIHHWLEDRIGLSDEEELLEVEDVLDRSPGASQYATPSLAKLLPITAIALPLPAKTRSSVIQKMAELAAGTGLLWDADKMVEAVRARESLHPTALDNGVALLHPRRPLSSILSEPLLALGRTYQGIPFGSARGTLTDIFFLICSTDDQVHLRVLARLSRLVGDEQFLSELRATESAADMHGVVERFEAELN